MLGGGTEQYKVKFLGAKHFSQIGNNKMKDSPDYNAFKQNSQKGDQKAPAYSSSRLNKHIYKIKMTTNHIKTNQRQKQNQTHLWTAVGSLGNLTFFFCTWPYKQPDLHRTWHCLRDYKVHGPCFLIHFSLLL